MAQRQAQAERRCFCQDLQQSFLSAVVGRARSALSGCELAPDDSATISSSRIACTTQGEKEKILQQLRVGQNMCYRRDVHSDDGVQADTSRSKPDVQQLGLVHRVLWRLKGPSGRRAATSSVFQTLATMRNKNTQEEPKPPWPLREHRLRARRWASSKWWPWGVSVVLPCK